MRGLVPCPRSHSHTAVSEAMLSILFIIRTPASVGLAYSRCSINISLITGLPGFWAALSTIADSVFFFSIRVTVQLKWKLQVRIGKWNRIKSHKKCSPWQLWVFHSPSAFQFIFQTQHQACLGSCWGDPLLGLPVLACPVSAGHRPSFTGPWFTACPVKFAFFFCSRQGLSCSSSKLVAVKEKLYWSKVDRQGRLYLRLWGQGHETKLHSAESKAGNLFK